MTFSSPIFNADKAIIGVIASRFNCKFLNDILKATIIDSSSEIYLLNLQGLVIGARGEQDLMHKEFKGMSFLNNFQAGAFGALEEAAKPNPTQAENGDEPPAYFLGYAFSKGYNTYKGQKWVVFTRRTRESVNLSQKITPAQRFKQLRTGKLKAVA